MIFSVKQFICPLLLVWFSSFFKTFYPIESLCSVLYTVKYNQFLFQRLMNPVVLQNLPSSWSLKLCGDTSVVSLSWFGLSLLSQRSLCWAFPLSCLNETHFGPSVWHVVLAPGVPSTVCRQILLLKWAEFCLWAWNKAIASFPGCCSISIPCFHKNFRIPPQESYHGNEKSNGLVISFYCSTEHLTRMFWEQDWRGVTAFASPKLWGKSVLLWQSQESQKVPGKMFCQPGHVYNAASRCC